MDLAKLMQWLKSQDSSDNYMEPPQIYSDSEAYPPQWHMFKRNPDLHSQMFPQESGKFNEPVNNKTGIEIWRREMILQELRRRLSVIGKRGQL